MNSQPHHSIDLFCYIVINSMSEDGFVNSIIRIEERLINLCFYFSRPKKDVEFFNYDEVEYGLADDLNWFEDQVKKFCLCSIKVFFTSQAFTNPSTKITYLLLITMISNGSVPTEKLLISLHNYREQCRLHNTIVFHTYIVPWSPHHGGNFWPPPKAERELVYI